MKAIISMKEAKEKLLELYQAKNPDITEIVIEGMVTIEETNKLLKDATDGHVTIESVPIPEPDEMVRLAASLQQVVVEQSTFSVRYLKGKNKGILWEVSKELANQCIYCSYIAMDDNDQSLHKKTYHKEQWKAEREKEKEQLSIARKVMEEKVVDKLGEPSWVRRGQS